MLAKGNSKLGKEIWSWSIPAILTCPGRSTVCEKLCYADANYYKTDGVKSRLSLNYKLSQSPNFAPWMIVELETKKISILRIHAAGDFYSIPYIKKWISIIKNSPNIRFFVYTRSWRMAAFRKELIVLSKLPNVKLWYSSDKETGQPKLTSDEKIIRIAYMSVEDGDTAPSSSNLVFRVKRKTIMKKMNGIQVCPVEQNVKYREKMTCTRCKICFTGTEVPLNRISLTVL